MAAILKTDRLKVSPSNIIEYVGASAGLRESLNTIPPPHDIGSDQAMLV
jgi:hypothetical protein